MVYKGLIFAAPPMQGAEELALTPPYLRRALKTVSETQLKNRVCGAS
jgi:hypothetical protein